MVESVIITRHRYQVIRLWEQDPEPLLANRALLPFAVLARSDAPNTLLEQVVSQLDRTLRTTPTG